MGPQTLNLGGEADGAEYEEEEDVVEMMVVVVVEAVVEVEMAAGVALDRMIPWLVIGAGCVVIWPVTVLNPVMHSRREVATLALSEEDLLNPGKKAHVDVVVVDQFGSVA